MSDAITAAIVGAGAIGARLDAPGASPPLTHAGGYRSAGFALAAFVDVDPAAATLARQWGCAYYADFDAMMRACAPQIISLAVPAAARAEILRRALHFRPRAVIAEKPLTSSLGESEAIVALYRQAGIPLLVNYSRRFIPAWRALQGAAALSATILYAKGLRQNGTHALDLCRMLFGECLEARPLAAKSDYWSDDPTVSAFLRFERCNEVFLHGLNEQNFTLFEVDIIAPSWRVAVDRDGRRLRRYALQENAGIPPGRRLVEGKEEDTGAAMAMTNLMHHLRDVLGGAEPWCRGDDAIAAERIADLLSR